MGAHDEDDFLCATPPSATDAYTQLDGQRFSDPQDSQGRPRTSDAAVARPPHPAHGAPSPLAEAALRPGLRSQRRRGGEVRYTDGETTAARGGGAKARRISRFKSQEVNASKDAVSDLRLEAPNTGITGALAAPRGSCAGELPFVVSQPQTHRGSR